MGRPSYKRHIFRIESEVSPDGMVHVALPDLAPGDKVTVTVQKRAPVIQCERVFGRWRGTNEILPGFDEPIEGLEWAYP